MPRRASALARWLSLAAAPAGRAAGGHRLLPDWQANLKVVSEPERVTTSHLNELESGRQAEVPDAAAAA
jgi:hypothetical protein